MKAASRRNPVLVECMMYTLYSSIMCVLVKTMCICVSKIVLV
jgi:hypothetical protein